MMILIIEDAEDVANIIEEICNKSGYTSVVACNGFEAVELASEIVFAMALIDIVVPGLSGGEAALAIRALPKPNGSVPMVVVTGGLVEFDITRPPYDVFSALVQKPFGRQELVDIINRYAREKV